MIIFHTVSNCGSWSQFCNDSWYCEKL